MVGWGRVGSSVFLTNDESHKMGYQFVETLVVWGRVGPSDLLTNDGSHKIGYKKSPPCHGIWFSMPWKLKSYENLRAVTKVRPTFVGASWEGSTDEDPPPGWGLL